MVVLVDQADLRPAADLATKNEKSRYVHDALWSKRQATQEPVVQWLRERGLEHRSFYIINAILVKGSREVADALAARPDVARVEGNPQIQNVLPQPITAIEAPLQSETPNAIEPNINYTHAPQVWARGFTGRGLVIGTADTGVRWTHNALKVTIAAGAEQWPTTITTGMTLFTTALATPAVTIRMRLAMTRVMEPIP